MVLLTFGKHKGKHVSKVDSQYLWYLTCWELNGIERKPFWSNYDFEGSWRDKMQYISDTTNSSYVKSRVWLAKNKYYIVKHARKVWLDRKLCCHCQRVLVAVGNSRVAGKNHDDWEYRYLHKKCFFELE